MDTPSLPEGFESPETADTERAAQWRQFYDQVISFEEGILGQMIELSRDMSAQQKRLVQETKIGPLRFLIENFSSAATSGGGGMPRRTNPPPDGTRRRTRVSGSRFRR
jgi:hypothetical protein